MENAGKIIYPFELSDESRAAIGVCSFFRYVRVIGYGQNETSAFESPAGAYLKSVAIDAGAVTCVFTVGGSAIGLDATDVTVTVASGASSGHGDSGNVSIDVGVYQEYFDALEATEGLELWLCLECLLLFRRSGVVIVQDELTYDPAAPVTTDTVALSVNGSLELSDGNNVKVFFRDGTVHLDASPGAGIGKYFVDPWSGVYVSPYFGIRSINGLRDDVEISASPAVAAAGGVNIYVG